MQWEDKMNDKIKGWLQRVKIFMWYLGTEPFRQIKEIFLALLDIFRALNRPLTWAYISLFAIMFAIYYGKKRMATIFLIFLLFVILLWEWQRGFFMKRYRDKYKEKIKEELQEYEPEKMERREEK